MVSKQDQLVYEAVLERERLMYYLPGPYEPTEKDWAQFQAWLAADPWVCAAPFIDPSAWETCSGEMTRDHVHEHTGGTKSKRAPTTMETVVILCRHHHLNGWATSHRPEIRAYIKEANERYRDITDRP